MNSKLLFILLFSFFTFHIASSQQIMIESKYDIIHVVSEANTKLNQIYAHRGMPKGELQKAIYAANNELIGLRKQLIESQRANNTKLSSLESTLNELKTKEETISADMSDQDLITAINEIRNIAATLNNNTKTAIK